MNKEDLLYHYFSKSLTPSQETLFYDLLEKDEAFKAQFEFESNLKRVIREDENKKLKTKLQGFEKETTKAKSKSIFNYSNLAIAASIALLIGWFGYNSFFGTNYNELYESNFENYPNTVYTITRSDTINAIERQAFVAYEAEDYKNAIVYLNQLDNNVKPYLDFYKAQSYLKLNKTDEAKGYFDKVIAENKVFVAESHWYMSLIYLKEENKTEAKLELKKLIEGYNYSKEKAKALLIELD